MEGEEAVFGGARIGRCFNGGMVGDLIFEEDFLESEREEM